MTEKAKTFFDILNAVDVNGHTEQKNGLTYLSWAWAVAEVSKRCPDMTYEVCRFDNGHGILLPYMYDENTGYMCMTKVTIDGVTKEMWLPVMDNNNHAMKSVPYEIVTRYKTIPVSAATMFDVNKTIMRCLTKNLAMFGLGLYIYAGEDLPETSDDLNKETEKTPAQKAQETKQANKEAFENSFNTMYEAFKSGKVKWSYDMENRFNAIMKEAMSKGYEQDKCSELLEMFDKLEKDRIVY